MTYRDTDLAPEPQEIKSKPGFLGKVFNFAVTIILALVMAWALQTFVFQFYQVEQGSMETTLEPNQIILVDKLSPNFTPYAAGDVVVFHSPPELDLGGQPFVKRIIGMPGDKVELKDGLVFINGISLHEPYVNSPDGTQPELEHASSWTVPAGSVFLMGDHRSESRDSRDFGPEPISSIIGRAYIRALPDPSFFNKAPWDSGL